MMLSLLKQYEPIRKGDSSMLQVLLNFCVNGTVVASLIIPERFQHILM